MLQQVDVGCPFYMYDDGKKKITCEGITEDSSLTSCFRDGAGYRTQMEVFCCEHYTKCEIYRMLMEKYED